MNMACFVLANIVKAQEAERIHEEVALELCCVFALATVWLISLLYALELDE